MTTRRDFLRYSAAGSLAALGGRLPAALGAEPGDARPHSGLKLLILGGTGFLGPAIVDAAKARGHTLTLFNRGRTNPKLFPDLEKLRGDRDPKKGDGLKALEKRKWDAVFDDCGYFPRMVRASAELLAPSIGHYVYISSISAYKDSSKPDTTEDAPLATMDDPTLETMGQNYQYYGALKALCEQAAEKAAPAKTTVVRPGYIVGPGDPTDRFTYWPLRVRDATGDRAEVLAPGSPGDPIQIIDVRDLAAWLVRLVEQKVFGRFNACGPARRLTMGEILDSSKSVTNSDARFTWVSPDFIVKVEEQLDLPIWAPATGESAGAHAWSNARAIAAGLTFRPVRDTIKDTLDWFSKLPEDRRTKLRAGLKPEIETRVLEKWHKQARKS